VIGRGAKTGSSLSSSSAMSRARAVPLARSAFMTGSRFKRTKSGYGGVTAKRIRPVTWRAESVHCRYELTTVLLVF
jgi:hypothetical protein